MTNDEFWAILHAPIAEHPIFFRAYYDETGLVKSYTMEDIPGNYIEVTSETFHLAPPARVVNGKLVVINPTSLVTKLYPGDQGTPCDPGDVCIVVDKSHPHTKWLLK